MSDLARYIVLTKAVGETPLSCVEAWREKHPAYAGVSLAYAGRLDPMASGKLLILIGEECKEQEKYHNLDKEYTFRVLFGVSSDSLDVLGLVRESGSRTATTPDLEHTLATLTGDISLPYPIFSSRTVHGKPLHTWALEGRLGEIEIPTKHSTVYSLTLDKLSELNRADVVREARLQFESIPPVTDARKAIGNDFRRTDVRDTWNTIEMSGQPTDEFTIATITCVASSGTYMRSLAEEIAKRLGTTGLAFSIHRSIIGQYDTATKSWREKFE
jgi:tRNA pseudouridine55 synthase